MMTHSRSSGSRSNPTHQRLLQRGPLALIKLNVSRQSHGRSQFQIRWGAEEARHADLWRNALLFLRQRTPQWIGEYAQATGLADIDRTTFVPSGLA